MTDQISLLGKNKQTNKQKQNKNQVAFETLLPCFEYRCFYLKLSYYSKYATTGILCRQLRTNSMCLIPGQITAILQYMHFIKDPHIYVK